MTKEIKGQPGYFITSDGKVLSKRTDKGHRSKYS
jgi:hypothetical protein